MPDSRIKFRNFNRRLWVSGGRDQCPEGGMRRCTGAAPELTGSVYSRYGSTTTFQSVAALNIVTFNGHVYSYDGSILYKDGVNIQSGFNGNRGAFVTMPPQIGITDYLFFAGGGLMVKVDPLGNVTNWGINGPNDQGTATNLANDLIVIDTFNNSAANWTANANVTSKANEATEFIVLNANDAGGSLKMNPNNSQGPWRLTNSTVATLNLGNYPNHDISLPNDVIQFWCMFDKLGTNNTQTSWIQLDFDVNDGTFKRDYYTFAWGFVPTGATNPVVHHPVSLNLSVSPGQWQQVTLAKSTFNRIGNTLNLDWSNVQAIRFSGGAFVGNLFLDYFTMNGGSPLGAGPAVGNGGVEYEYYFTFQNLTTGSESHPSAVSTKVFDTQLNQVQLSKIPTSSDAQVSARRIYRTSSETTGGGQSAFYVDTLYDNVTTTYTDNFSDFTQPITLTPWQKSVAVPPNGAADYYVDSGTGYYFKLTGSGTTGAQPPTWVIPTSVWIAIASFVVNETIAPPEAAPFFYKVTSITGSGISGLVRPNFASLAATIVDGQVTWTKTTPATTPDGTATWTFQGINSTRFLDSNQQLNLDNQYPLSTYNDAVGPFSGCMFWCRDSTSGNKGKVYYSPAGKPESVIGFVQASTDDDPTEKLAIWDERLWLFTSRRVIPIIPIQQADGSTTFGAGDPVLGARGTTAPFSVIPMSQGVIYQASDGIRLMNNANNPLIAFDAIASLERGKSEENIPVFGAVIAASCRGEIMFSNALNMVLSFVYAQESPVWRIPIKQAVTAIFYDASTDTIYASWSSTIFRLEDPQIFTDLGFPLPIEWQTGSVLMDGGQFGFLKRVFIDVNCNGQVLTPTICLDSADTAIPDITNSSRGIIEIEIQAVSKLLGVRLSGNVGSRVEWFGWEADVRVGDDNLQ